MQTQRVGESRGMKKKGMRKRLEGGKGGGNRNRGRKKKAKKGEEEKA
jgi:hypothetical protein